MPAIAALIIRLTVSILAAGGVSLAQPVDLSGVWEMDNGKEKAHIEIVETDGVYSGRIVWLENPIFPPNDPKGMAGQPRIDRLNPDPELRTRPIIGLQILSGLRPAGENSWQDGRIYAPDRGDSYQCKASLTRDGVLEVRGFVGFSLFGRTMRWVRVESSGGS